MISLTNSFFQKIKNHYRNLKNISLAFWGISFKKDTDDLKNSPALDLLCRLLEAGAEIHVYDSSLCSEEGFLLFLIKNHLRQQMVSNLKLF